MREATPAALDVFAQNPYRNETMLAQASPLHIVLFLSINVECGAYIGYVF